MKNFVVVADKRTGSSFFQEALSSHPNIKCYDELFMIRGAKKTGKRRGQYLYRHMKQTESMDIGGYINWIFETKQNKSVGFRLMYPQDAYWKALKVIKKKKIPVIHLVREDLLGMVLSKKTKGLFEVKEQNFDVNNIIADMKNHEKKQNEYFKKLKDHKNLLTLKYEDIIGRTEGEKGEVKKFGAFNLLSNMTTYVPLDVSHKICEFLNEEPMELYSNVTKKNSPNPWDYIKNKDELKEALKKEGYEGWIK